MHRPRLALTALALALAACTATPALSPTLPPVPLQDRAAAVAAAEALTSIGGPWQVGDVVEGRYADLFQGSTNDPTGVGASQRAVNSDKIIWRVDLTGPNGSQQLYIEAATGVLIDYIVQGH